jgi:hypothetical protein
VPIDALKNIIFKSTFNMGIFNILNIKWKIIIMLITIQNKILFWIY